MALYAFASGVSGQVGPWRSDFLRSYSVWDLLEIDMVKFISFKAVVLVGASLFCLGGSGMLLSQGRGEGVPAGSVEKKRETITLEAALGRLEGRLLKAERLVQEAREERQGEIDSLKYQMHELQSLVDGLFKRLELQEKKVDKAIKKIDKVVKVVKAPGAAPPFVSSPLKYHIVQNGETLYRISKKYRVSERQLIRLNRLKDKTRIFVGQKLRVTP